MLSAFRKRNRQQKKLEVVGEVQNGGQTMVKITNQFGQVKINFEEFRRLLNLEGLVNVKLPQLTYNPLYPPFLRGNTLENGKNHR